MAMSGAYIAMVMAESSAANALAIGAFNGQLVCYDLKMLEEDDGKHCHQGVFTYQSNYI